MNQDEVSVKKRSGLLWAIRVLYIIIVIVLIANIFSLISYLNYARELDLLFFDTSYIAYAILIIALVSQFPYVFLNRTGKIKGNVMYLVALVMYTANKLSDAIYDLINYQEFGIILTILVLAVFIAFYFLMKRLDKGKVIASYPEESLVKKVVKVIKDNRM